MADKTTTGMILVTKRYYWKGVLQYVTQQDMPSMAVSSSITTETKTSVNTGKFVPNVFRINPYAVVRESAYVAGSGTIIGRRAVDSNSTWEYEYSGPLAGIPFSNRYCWQVPLFSQDSELQRLANVCLQKAYSKVGSSEFGGLENLGELRETISMLRDPFKELREYLTSPFGKTGFSKGRILSALAKPKALSSQGILDHLGKLGKTAASTWLEIRCGLKPLILTICDLIDLANKVTKRFDANRVRSKRSKVYIERHTAEKYTGGSTAMVQMKGKCECTHRIKLCGIVYYKQSKDFSQAQKLGLDLRYVPEAMWELTRLSFVWDWLFSVGPWLGSLRVQPEITYLGSTTSCKIDSVGQLTLDPRSATGNEFGTLYKLSGDSAQVKFNGARFTRQVNGIQPPSLPLFRGTTGLDFFKVLDGLSLIIQSLTHSLR